MTCVGKEQKKKQKLLVSFIIYSLTNLKTFVVVLSTVYSI